MIHKSPNSKSRNSSILLKIIEDLTGQKAPIPNRVPEQAIDFLCKKDTLGLGYSQLNELLLYLGYDRISHSFFQYLVNGTLHYQTGASIKSLDEFRNGADAFRKVAILFFGNIKFAFKTLSRNDAILRTYIGRTAKRREGNFFDRHQQILPPKAIAKEETHLLGYVIGSQIEKDLEKTPNDEQLLEIRKRRAELIKIGKLNHQAYLISDHLDVYIATSMRERHEFESVHETTRAIFAHEHLKQLNLRWFDPTQAYCDHRIDKGIAEGLMLRRAKCTIYFAQESDTLGKDSELACTLAQGKPVIAFVPKPSESAARDIIKTLSITGTKRTDIILQQLRLYAPDSAWTDPEIQKWASNPSAIPEDAAIKRLQSCMDSHFEKRNRILRDIHPLGIQMNLQTGVANGVLVANSIEQCARLVRALLLRELEFELSEDQDPNRAGYLYLREKISNSIFRVVSGDAFLTNAFWNFYLNPNEESYRGNDKDEDDDYKKSPNDPYDLTRSTSQQPNRLNYTSETEGK